MIEKTLRGVPPQRTITAPLAESRDHTEEDLRQRYFLQSELTQGGVVAPFPEPLTGH